MKKCAVTGVFDPITLGHLDIIKRAAQMFDEVVVTVLINPTKEEDLDLNDKLHIINTAVKDLPRVCVTSYDGMTVDFCAQNDIKFIVRGVRNITDFNYEKSMADYNLEHGGVETVFLPCREEYKDISSTLARSKKEKEELVGILPSGTIDYYLKHRKQ